MSFTLSRSFLGAECEMLTRFVEEEKYLVGFFGDEYVQYRERTTVGIPFIP